MACCRRNFALRRCEGIKVTRKMTIQSVAVNQPVDDALFAKPQLMAKASGK